MKIIVAALAGSLLLGACAAPVPPAPAAPALPSPEQQIQDQITAMAAPNQNLATARVHDDDNCFWFSYVGPVETTELPLLTREGRHICAPKPAEAEAPAEPATAS